MTTYNTGNPVPSADARDRYDNTQTFDELIAGTELSTVDRTGRTRKTWDGFQQDFNNFLIASGYEPIHLTYVVGTPLTVNRPTQLIDYNGSVYRVKMPATFPVNLTGVWATDSTKLVDVGDQSLRQALANPVQGGRLAGFKSPLANSIATTLDEVGKRSSNVFDWFTDAQKADVRSGALAVDCSAAIQAALDAMTTYTNTQTRALRFPWGNYRLNTPINFQDFKDVTIFMEGARFHAYNTGPIDGLLVFRNTDNVRVLGAWSGHARNQTNVETLIRMTVKLPSEGIPGKGLCVRTRLENFTGYGAKNVVHCGSYDKDDLVSEIVLSGIHAFDCTGVLRIAGSQTIVDVTDSIITSEPNAVLNATPGTCVEYSIWMEGGNLTMRGGELTHLLSTSGYLVRVNPCSSAAFNSPWPSVSLLGTHIETAAFGCYANNERSLPSLTSAISQFSMTECKGYISSSMAGQPLFVNADPSNAMKFKFRNNNFYCDTPRTGFNVDLAGVLATVDTDKQSWGSNFLHWLGGVRGGITLHPRLQAVAVDNLNSQSVAAAATATMKWTAERTTGLFQRYAASYVGSTGTFTVPKGGASEIKIKASGLFSNALTTARSDQSAGYASILRNGVPIALKNINVGDKGFSVEFEDCQVAADTTYVVQITNLGTNTMQFGILAADKFDVFISTL